MQIEHQEKFYRVLTHRISIYEFETWLYQHESLEHQLPNLLYLELVSLDYTLAENQTLNQLHNLLNSHLEFYKFVKIELIECLQSIIDKDEHCGKSIWNTYVMYDNGYDFLRRLGLEYGLCLCDNNGDFLHIDNNKLIDKFYPKIISDANNVLNWLLHDKIIFKNIMNEYGSYEYDDLRNELEKSQGELTAVMESETPTLPPNLLRFQICQTIQIIKNKLFNH